MGKTRIINEREAEELLTMELCIPAMEETLREVSAKGTTNLQRNMISLEGDNKFATMPCAIHGKGLAGCKVIVFPGAEAKKAGTNQGIIPIFNTKTGGLTAIVDGECITGVRTAATSAVATRLLARKGAKTMSILGAGRLGRMHIEAIRLDFAIEKVYIWDIVPAATQALCKYVTETLGIEAVACATAKEAVVDGDIVCTVSQAKTPILEGAWLKKGAHLNAIGAAPPVGGSWTMRRCLGAASMWTRERRFSRMRGISSFPWGKGS